MKLLSRPSELRPLHPEPYCKELPLRSKNISKIWAISASTSEFKKALNVTISSAKFEDKVIPQIDDPVQINTFFPILIVSCLAMKVLTLMKLMKILVLSKLLSPNSITL